MTNERFALQAKAIGKRFYNRWLFKDISFQLCAGERMALVGTNGSGKSTLLRIVAGQLAPTIGGMTYSAAGNNIPSDRFYRHLSWTGPQVEPYTELTLREHIDLHFRFKQCLLPQPESLIQILNLSAHADKPLQVYSSGMLQRMKVGLALFTASDVLLLDEPTSNMDEENAAFMLDLIAQHIGQRVYVLATNLRREYEQFDRVLTLG